MILQGDDNTKFFHLLANGRYRKTRITQLEQEEGIITNHFSIEEDIRDDIPQVSAMQNEVLTCHFSEEEIKNVVFQMDLNFGIITLAFLIAKDREHFQGVIPHINENWNTQKFFDSYGVNVGYKKNKWLFKLINEEGMPVRCLFKIGDGTQKQIMVTGQSHKPENSILHKQSSSLGRGDLRFSDKL
ncbi:hypothetical protein ACJX0J_013330, partial [Zea mays]